MPASNQQIAKRINRVLSFLPELFQNQKNFQAVMGAIGQSDADLENLFIEVRKQLFVDTAEGQYLDMLGANVGVIRPPLIGMVDRDYKEFIKLQTYYPKQIKQLLFRLMELFYGRDTIKANIRSTATGPFVIFDKANLLIKVDGFEELIEITFSAASFNNPNNVTAEEIAAQINAQAPSSIFAATYFNAIDKFDFVEIFTNTFGPVGSIEIVGGSANRFLKFPETLRLGTTVASQYRLVKQNTTMKLYWADGDNPNFALLRSGDSVLTTGSPFLAANVGSFLLSDIVDTGVPAAILTATSALFQSANVVRYAMPSTVGAVAGNEVTIEGFLNPVNNGVFTVLTVSAGYIDVQSARLDNSADEAATATVDLINNASYISFLNENGANQNTFGVVSVDDVLFFRPTRKKLESAKRPATVWEVNSNEIIITLPATPVVVRRGLAGSAHVQGTTANLVRAFTSTADLLNPEFFPITNGSFYLQKPNGLVLRDVRYNYSVKNNNELINITPSLTPVGEKLKMGIGPLSAQSGSNIVTVSTIEPHGLISGELTRFANFNGFAGILQQDLNGNRPVSSIIDDLTFTITAGTNATVTTTNAPAVDQGEIFTVRNSKVFLTNVQQETGYVGSFIFDQKNAPYTISGLQTTLLQNVLLGDFGNSIQVHDSTVFPESSGDLVINYGRLDEEGPIPYIAKPSAGTIFLDPSYRFKKSHTSGAAISLLRSKFATEPGSTGKNYPVYIVDTVSPREKLQDLLLDAKAAGVAVRFIVILPNNVYNAFSIYEL
jgi:hypothetical protein